MFDFEKLPVYILAEKTYQEINNNILKRISNKNILDQLERSTLSILLNIAEGLGKYTKKDKKNFYIIARASVYESVAIFRVLKIQGNISQEVYKDFYEKFAELSKMPSGLIKKMINDF